MADLVFTSFSGTTRPTAFGLYDSDTIFQSDADKIVYFVQRNLGAPVVESELDLRQIWTAFEQATLEYSSEINKAHARNVLLDMLGSPTGTLSGSENAYVISNSTEFARTITIQYAYEFGANSPFPTFTASINLVAGQNRYDLLGPITASTGIPSGSLVQIRKVHHYEPSAAYRFFDTTSVLNFMGNALGFESYSPETIFYLLPIWEDVLRGTQLQLNQRVRRSNYSFEIHGYELILYPTPTRSQRLFYEYTISRNAGTDLTSSIGNTLLHQSRGVVSNLSNIAFGHIGYRDINSIGRVWIWKMTLAFCKEILGESIRNKYKEMPTLEANISLNGAELAQQGREDQVNMRQELLELLEKMSYRSLMEERQQLQSLAVEEWKRVPLLIYISK